MSGDDSRDEPDWAALFEARDLAEAFQAAEGPDAAEDGAGVGAGPEGRDRTSPELPK